MSHLTWSPGVAPILRGSHEKLWPKAAETNDTQLVMPEILDLLRLFIKSFTCIYGVLQIPGGAGFQKGTVCQGVVELFVVVYNFGVLQGFGGLIYTRIYSRVACCCLLFKYTLYPAKKHALSKNSLAWSSGRYRAATTKHPTSCQTHW